MSHPEQLGFFGAVARTNPDLIDGANVLEVGAYDVNGSVRSIFDTSAEYVGVDLVEGPGVDRVAYGHEVDDMDGLYDVTVSGECFEHDPHWQATFQNMVRMTRPGGLVAFTCASRGRPEHGTTRTVMTESPGTQAEGLDYYRNLTARDFEVGLSLDSMFSTYRFWYLPTSFDLYFAGVRVGDGSAELPSASLPPDGVVKRLRSLMPLSHRLVRLPLKLAVRLISEKHYQSFVLPYWLGLMKIQDRLVSGRFRRSAVT